MKIVNIIDDLFHQPYFVCLLAIISCFCFYYLKSEKKTRRKIIWTIYLSIFFIGLITFIGTAIYRIYHPQKWDFTCFYLYGKVAAAGYDYYLPENFHLVFNSLTLPIENYDNFTRECVNVGFLYPPPSILYFIPLGFLTYKTALIVWTIFNLIFVSGCLYLIYDMFFKPYKLNGLILVAILFFILKPSLSTVSYAQTNFILLFYLLLMKKYSDTKYAGIFLALALFTKPYMIIFILYFILRKNWKAISYFIMSSVIISGLTVALVGTAPFMSYIFDNAAQRLPKAVFYEDLNQSLNAILLRSNLITLDSPMIYICIMLGVLLVTAFYLFYLLRRKLYDYIWIILLLIGLIIYPGTLSYYGVLLLFIIFQLFDEKEQLGFNRYLSIPIIGIFYYLNTASLFISICFLLSVAILKSLNSFQQMRLVLDKT